MSNNSATSCLSAESHNKDIKDPLVHYFGCTPFNDRKALLDIKHEIWTTEREHQEFLEADRGTDEKEIKGKANESVEAIRKRWENNVNKELRRIRVLRAAIEKNEVVRDPVPEGSQRHETANRDVSDNNATGNLVTAVNKCREKWRKSLAERKGRVYTPNPPTTGLDAEYVPEKDVSVGIIQFENGEPFNETSGMSNENNKSFDNNKGLIWGKFPDQKTSVQSLLYEGDTKEPKKNLLHKDRISNDSDRIRYFHIPLNNMIWAEEAISRYFGEGRPDFTSFRRQLQRQDKTRSSIILQDRYWRGQLQADEGGPPHARYMSPICEIISSKKELENTDLAPTNMVLFMPYLHWETSKKREYFASEMEDIMAKASQKKIHDENVNKQQRIIDRGGSSSVNTDSKTQMDPTRWARAYDYVKTIPRNFNRATAHSGTKTSKMNAQTRKRLEIAVDALAAVRSPFEPQTPLGRYLMAISKLHEGMANYRDKALLGKYLPENPPLHPRRTLDQAFYWTLRSTKKRDCDQVVFRGTTAKPDDFHRFDSEKKEWPKHKEFNIGGACLGCSHSIQKLSRVIMVDQLWMWILDSKTIITCFPKRYGANKNDASGIHKSIRSRLGEIGSVHSIFELGLVILDECSKTFFDRTKTLDRRPQVINEFARAIGNIMHEQSVSFNRLWWWTEQMKLVYSAKGYNDTSNLRMALLDINPEGRLDREIEDIIEELDIMIHLANTNNDILKKFVEQAEHILNPNGEFKCNNDSQQHIRSKMESLSEKEAGKGGKKEDKEREKREIAYHCFKQKANEGQARAIDHIRELEKLRQSAKKTADDVLHLLSMKQQQASVFQAWQAMKQSDETIRQGQSIMTFTLVTIVFLPLSFLSSVFGMNNKELGNDNWPISRQIIYIFSISAGVVFFSLLLAFSSWTRAFIWSLYVRSSTTVAVKSGLYDFYLSRPTERIYEDAANRIYRTKRDRRKEFFERKSNKRLEKEQQEDQPEADAYKSSSVSTLFGSRTHRPQNGSGGSVGSNVPDLENGALTPPSANGTHDSTLNGRA
ncbi:hypothetical protein F5Y10DRAFT_289841 [Nemania abortiva]|nr:hypothetical protein F5Y10DRAFT_289841 [Nemania abortiva]